MWLEGGGEEAKVQALTEGKHLCVRLLALELQRCAPDSETVEPGWRDGTQVNRQAKKDTPALLCFSPSPAQLSGPGWS